MRIKNQSVVIVGPTASGKTELSINLAKKLHAEVINTDSRLFYKNLNIGTGKPTKNDLQSVNHYLIDIVNPNEKFSLAEFINESKKIIDSIYLKDKNPILVGGSGQYSKALIEGWDIPEIPPDEDLRNSLEEVLLKKGVDYLYKKLKNDFPENAINIDFKNPRRIIRAYELGKNNVIRNKKNKITNNYKFKIFGLTMERNLLYSRIDNRIDEMLDNGWVNEVEGLIKLGCDQNSNSFSSIGYREIYSFIQGENSFEDVVLMIKKKTRNLVRHQYNWFKLNDPEINWFDASKDSQENIIKKIVKDLNEN